MIVRRRPYTLRRARCLPIPQVAAGYDCLQQWRDRMLKQPILRHSLATLLCVALSVASGATLAHDDSHRPGKDARYPRLSLQAEAVSEVPEDTVEITLAVEIEGTDQTEVARQLA